MLHFGLHFLLQLQYIDSLRVSTNDISAVLPQLSQVHNTLPLVSLGYIIITFNHPYISIVIKPITVILFIVTTKQISHE